tara:strand:- start:87 stop:407 length:321 start_codon:yes stop_codon:yes gene_type:complete
MGYDIIGERKEKIMNLVDRQFKLWKARHKAELERFKKFTTKRFYIKRGMNSMSKKKTYRYHIDETLPLIPDDYQLRDIVYDKEENTLTLQGQLYNIELVIPVCPMK